MTCGVYCITHLASGRSYVGQARNIEERWERHRKGDTNRYLRNILSEEGPDALAFDILEEVAPEVLNEREVFWIERLGTMYPAGLNLTAGGRVPDEVSPEVRRIMSNSAKRAWEDPERKKAHAELCRERFKNPGYRVQTVHSPEAREKIAAGMRLRTAKMNEKRWGGHRVR